MTDKYSVLGLRPPGLDFRILCLEAFHSSHHPQEVQILTYKDGSGTERIKNILMAVDPAEYFSIYHREQRVF